KPMTNDMASRAEKSAVRPTTTFYDLLMRHDAVLNQYRASPACSRCRATADGSPPRPGASGTSRPAPARPPRKRPVRPRQRLQLQLDKFLETQSRTSRTHVVVLRFDHWNPPASTLPAQSPYSLRQGQFLETYCGNSPDRIRRLISSRAAALI